MSGDTMTTKPELTIEELDSWDDLLERSQGTKFIFTIPQARRLLTAARRSIEERKVMPNEANSENSRTAPTGYVAKPPQDMGPEPWRSVAASSPEQIARDELNKVSRQADDAMKRLKKQFSSYDYATLAEELEGWCVERPIDQETHDLLCKAANALIQVKRKIAFAYERGKREGLEEAAQQAESWAVGGNDVTGIVRDNTCKSIAAELRSRARAKP